MSRDPVEYLADQRRALCTECKRNVKSSPDLAFFVSGGDYKSSPLYEDWVRLSADRSRWYQENLAYPKSMTLSADEKARLEEINKSKIKECQSLFREVERTASSDSYYCGCQGWN